MARLQDFQTVTPTSSDKLLVVQSQGQGLVPYGSKLDSANPTGSGYVSMNRKAGTGIGVNSVAAGDDVTASGNNSHAEGYNTVASNLSAHAEGTGTTASGERSHAEGRGTKAEGNFSHSQGDGTIASHRSQSVLGEYNLRDTSSATYANRGTYVEIVGNGSNDANRSNARTLDWSGNEVLAGDLAINGNTSVNAAIEKTTSVVTMETGYSSTTNAIVKIGKTVFLSLVFSASTDISSRVTVGKLPEGFRPVATIGISAPASTQVNYYANRLTNTLIASNGDIIVGDLVLPNGTVKEVRITTAFITS